MDCPRCKEPVEHGRCPRCGIVWDPEEADDGELLATPPGAEAPPEADEGQDPRPADTPAGGLIGMEVTPGKTPKRETPARADWREELRRRLDEHGGRKTAEQVEERKDHEAETAPADPEGSAAPREPKQEAAASAAGPAGVDVSAPPKGEPGDLAPAIFRYQLKQTESRPPLTNPVRPRQPAPTGATTAEAPGPAPASRTKKGLGVRPAIPKAASRATTPLFSQAGRLPFDKAVVESPPAESPPTEASAPVASRPVPASLPAEILFSRFLAGIIDVTLPAAGAVLLGLLAAWKTGIDVFAGGAWGWMLVLIGALYVLTSFLFLTLERQTPGLRAAELEVVHQDGSDEIAASNLLTRVLVFPLSVASIGGLACALFDRRRRCLHDILSRTLVVPARSLKRGRSGGR
ncbi:MAG: hypothetical protein Kow00109_16240 [Acidobacteriota bacterium]